MLLSRIEAVRLREKKIDMTLRRIGERNIADKDVALCQFFVLEQFTAFKRFVLKLQMFDFHNTTPRSIHPILWIASWSFIFLSACFYLYWILAWAGRTCYCYQLLISSFLNVYFLQQQTEVKCLLRGELLSPSTYLRIYLSFS